MLPCAQRQRAVGRASDIAAVPADVQHPGFPRIRARLEDAAFAAALRLRSTAYDKSAFARLKEIDAERLSYHEAKTPVMVAERTSKPLTIRVLARGNWMDESGEICKPAVPQFLPHAQAPSNRPLTRLDLAHWLCSAENPLTARVIMNRLWRDLFGAGLSPQVDDLGAQGEPPSHPELLDWLAVEFRESGWDLKHMVKLMVMSQTYRQCSRIRPRCTRSIPTTVCWRHRRRAGSMRNSFVTTLLTIAGPGSGREACRPSPTSRLLLRWVVVPHRQYVADRPRNAAEFTCTGSGRFSIRCCLLDASGRRPYQTRSTANSPQQALTPLNDPSSSRPPAVA